jgi:hypothetical protein
MTDDQPDRDEFEEAARSIAREVSDFVERTVEQFDPDQIAGAIGVDPDRAREWVETAGDWLRGRVERWGEDPTAGAAPTRKADAPADDPLRGAGPHPLDVPTEEQGLALAALQSGRWTIEPGSRTLAAQGDGPGPSDALGLVRELRSHDWIDADGELTLVGRHALGRWLDSATRP